MLGLAHYDDSPDASNESPAPVPAEEAPAAAGAVAAGGSVPLLSIVDYFDDDKPEDPAPALGGSLDDEVIQKAQPRMVGGVQISVVKRTPTRSDTDDADAAGTSAPPAAAPEPNGRPAFVLPDSPPGNVDAKLSDKFMQLVRKTQEGYSVNEHIRKAKSFRNPDILEKLVNYFEVREFGTNYPPELYDPTALSKDEHFDRLEEARRKWEERQARKQGEKVGFTSGGMLEAGKAPAPAPAPAPTGEAKSRKSKWDSSGGGDPAAKRPAL